MTKPAVLFDLDGTLADTAPDLVAALNHLLEAADRPPMPYAIARNEVSNGAVGLLRLGFELPASRAVSPEMRQSFLDAYEKISNSNSRLFIGLEDISDIVSEIGASWGIVTNKPEFLTLPLLEQLGIAGDVGVVVSGDTLPERKPHPAPLHFAADHLGVAPGDCIYLGDARRDIEAGRAAGMRTIATLYGYIRPGEDVGSWQADALLNHPQNTLATLTQLLRAC